MLLDDFEELFDELDSAGDDEELDAVDEIEDLDELDKIIICEELDDFDETKITDDAEELTTIVEDVEELIMLELLTLDSIDDCTLDEL